MLQLKPRHNNKVLPHRELEPPLPHLQTHHHLLPLLAARHLPLPRRDPHPLLPVFPAGTAR